MEWFALAAKNMGFHVGFHEDSIQNGIYKKTYNLRVLAKKYLDYIPSLGSKDFRSEVGSCYRYSFDHGTNFSRGPWVKTEFDSQGLRCAWNRVYQPIRDHFDRTNDDFHNLMLEHSIFRQSHICPFSCWSSEDQNDIEADLRCILTQIEWGCGWFLSVRGGGKARVINPILVIFNDETKVCGKPCSFPETRMVYLWVLFHAFPQVYQFSSLAAQSWSSSVPWLKGFACCRISGLPALWVSHQVDMNFLYTLHHFNLLQKMATQSIATDGNISALRLFSESALELFFPSTPPSQVAQRTWAAFGVLWNCLLLPLGCVLWLGMGHTNIIGHEFFSARNGNVNCGWAKNIIGHGFFSAMEMEATIADFLKIGITSVCVSGHHFLLSAGTFSGDQPVNDPGV